MDADPSDTETELYDQENETDQLTSRGKFIITMKSLKKGKHYPCKYCETICDSSKALTDHLHEKHKIMYCKLCSKAFNNPTMYNCHLKSHSGSGHAWPTCGKLFAYASQLKMHQTLHSDEKHACAYKSCSKSFKNIGDLTRHLKLIVSTVMRILETLNCIDLNILSNSQVHL